MGRQMDARTCMDHGDIEMSMFNFVEKRRWYFAISALVIGIGIAAMVYSMVTTETHTPFRMSVDFQSGTRFAVSFTSPIEESVIRDALKTRDIQNPTVSRLGEEGQNRWQIRTRFLSADESQAVLEALNHAGELILDQVETASVSPTVGAEVTRAAAIAVVVAAGAILLFILVAFRQVPNAFRYGACAIVAMMHDILVAMGFMSIAGILLGWEADALFLTAMLTVIGFSVQDTIVVFDRIRENIPKHKKESFETIVNRSVLETMHRSLATQLNAIFVMVALLLFGGASIKHFIAVLLVGMLSGTYSSLFNAVPLLVAWEKREIPLIR